MPSAPARRLAALALVSGALAALSLTSPVPVLGSSIVVNVLDDTAADDGVCTLREAITAANTDTASGVMAGECTAGAGADVITFSANGTITLGSDLPSVTSDVTIDGGHSVTVDGNGGARPITIGSGTVELTALTIVGGDALVGGGITNAGTLTIGASTLSGNSAVIGGGINNVGTLTIADSTISGNSAGNLGGGIENDGGVLTITDSTIAGNTAGNIGAGLDSNSGTVTIARSTFTNNTPGNSGGGLALFGGTADLANITAAFNGEDQIAVVSATAVIRNSTVTGGGIGLQASGSETVVGTLIAGNALDVLDSIESSTANLIGVPVGLVLSDILDPAGLADNGGPTRTIALALTPDNPAIDAGDSVTCAAAPVSGLDQRGMPRPAACDIGAYEAQSPTIAAHANVSAAATSSAGAAVSFTAPAGTDEQGGTATVGCLPASGSTFAVGSTTVTCTATDAVGHTASGTFRVIISAFVTPSVSPSATPAASLLPDTSAPARDLGIATPVALLALLSLMAIGFQRLRFRPKT